MAPPKKEEEKNSYFLDPNLEIIKKQKINPTQKKLSISVLFGIGATIRIGQEIQCLPYAVFFLYLIF